MAIESKREKMTITFSYLQQGIMAFYNYKGKRIRTNDESLVCRFRYASLLLVIVKLLMKLLKYQSCSFTFFEAARFIQKNKVCG